MLDFKLDDKNLVILAVLVICVGSFAVVPDPTAIVTNAFSGLFGIATGQALNQKGTP